MHTLSTIINCPNCGQKNRISENSDNSQAICAKCWTRLIPLNESEIKAPPPPPKEPYTPPPYSKGESNEEKNESSSWWIWLVIGGLLWWIVAANSGNNKKLDSYNKSSSASVPQYPELPLPGNGAVQLYTNENRIAPLEIQTAEGANYLVKLVSSYSEQPVMTIFVRGGTAVTTEVPLGTYEVRYASGEKWYGYEHLFGPSTGYSKAESSFRFEKTGYDITGYTLTLYRVSNGNLRTSTINPSQF